MMVNAFDHTRCYACMDGVTLLVYRVVLPMMIAVQIVLVYLYRGAPAWWVKFGESLLG